MSRRSLLSVLGSLALSWSGTSVKPIAKNGSAYLQMKWKGCGCEPSRLVAWLFQSMLGRVWIRTCFHHLAAGSSPTVCESPPHQLLPPDGSPRSLRGLGLPPFYHSPQSSP